jgi:hypothetical protein
MYKCSESIFIGMLGLLAVVLFNGCTSNVVSIDARDSVSFTTLETSFPVSKDDVVTVKLRGSRTSGDYTQSVPDRMMILIDDTQIRGPATVSGSADLTYASVSIGPAATFGKDNRARGLLHIGVAQTNMDLTLVHEDTTYFTNDRTTELYMQWGLSYLIVPSLYGGGTLAFSLGPDLTGIREIDLRLDYALFEHLQLIGGFRWLKYDYLVEDDESVIRINFKGPFIGLNVPF